MWVWDSNKQVQRMDTVLERTENAQLALNRELETLPAGSSVFIVEEKGDHGIFSFREIRRLEANSQEPNKYDFEVSVYTRHDTRKARSFHFSCKPTDQAMEALCFGNVRVSENLLAARTPQDQGFSR